VLLLNHKMTKSGAKVPDKLAGPVCRGATFEPRPRISYPYLFEPTLCLGRDPVFLILEVALAPSRPSEAMVVVCPSFS